MPLLGSRMRRYVGCACWTSASDGSESPACDDFHNVTCGPIAQRRRRRRCGRMSEDDIEAWLDDLSTVADFDVSRSLFDRNDELDEDLKEGEVSTMGDLERTLSELSLHVAINSVIFTTTTSSSSSSSNRDVIGCRHSNSDMTTTSSGYEAGTCWSRDDDVIARSDDNDDDFRVSWSGSTGTTRPTVTRVYQVSPLRVAGRAVYVIDAERLALTSLPVMSPEVVRCVWDEHRRLRHDGVPPCRLTSGVWVDPPKTSKNCPVNSRNVEKGTQVPVKGPLRPRDQVIWNEHCCLPQSNHGLRNTEDCDEKSLNPLHATRDRQDAAVLSAYSYQQTSSSCRWNIESPITTRPGRPHPQRSDLDDDLRAGYDSDHNRLPAPETGNVAQPVFLGVELVDWLHCRVQRLSRRRDAVHYAQQLLVDGLIYRVDVEDGTRELCPSFRECCLYAFTPEPCDMYRDNWRRCLRSNAMES